MRGRGIVSKFLRAGRRFVGSDRPIVLMYHRVACMPVDPWRLAVSPARFTTQIELLARERSIVPMNWLAKELRESRLPRGAAAITFDDGYADVFQNALPVLRRFNCPACMFITTDRVNLTHGFWWDILSRVILETVDLPENLAIDIAGKPCEWTLSSNQRGAKISGAVDRETLHITLHRLLKPLAAECRRPILERLAAWAGTDCGLRPRDRVMTPDELLRLTAFDGIEIGAHTRTHPPLPVLSRNQLYWEIGESRRECEEIIGRRVTGFAYPFGDYNDASARAVGEIGLDYAVTTDEGEIGPQTDPFHIPRILVADWDEADYRREVLRYG